ncbi:MAG: oxidoreductase, partial [Marinilabiliales bacterium]
MKNILIIGSNSGIAKALIKQLLKEKNNVFAISKQEDSFIHENYTSFQTDILSEALPEKVTASEIDGFVYFPGTINLKPFKSIKEDTFRSDLEINLLGAIKSLQQIEKQLTENSSVLLFSSVAAQTGMPFHASVAASKGAVEGLT